MAWNDEPYRLEYTVRIGTMDDGRPVWVYLPETPHMLIAGTTGSGKSALLNVILAQLVKFNYVDDTQLILVDPKRVELSPYAKAPHIFRKVFFEPHEILSALAGANAEMDRRFKEWAPYGRDIEDINDQLSITVSDTADLWPRIFIVVDELANLVLSDKRFEQLLVRIASMGRAAGIHLILATQRPSADVITGLIRSNIPTRICLPVISKIESRIVLDETGAELLQKPGDILARLPGSRALVRFKGEYITDDEVDEAVADAVTRKGNWVRPAPIMAPL
jgi:DNA segregation ATPase FtsK/SpoIIIE, S-DNA-T family